MVASPRSVSYMTLARLDSSRRQQGRKQNGDNGMPWNNKGGSGGPWGSGGGGGGGGPWGGGGGGNRGSGGGGFGGQRPPDLEELLRKSQDKVRDILPGGFFSKRGILIIVIVALLLWLASGFYRVQTNEQGLPLVFGRYTGKPTGEGLQYNWPAPIGSVEIVKTTTQRRFEIGVQSGTPARGVRIDPLRNPQRNLMLTGDENIIDIQFVVIWSVHDPAAYAFNVRNADDVVRSGAEAAMREIIGKTELQYATTQGRRSIEESTRTLLQQIADDYRSGIRIDDVQLQKVDPPEQVIEAFRDVAAAGADKEREINQALAYRNEVIPRARGEAERIVQGAEAYKAEVVNRAQGDTQRFLSVYEQYSLSKDVTMERIYIETMEEVLRNVNKVLVDKSAGGSGVVPYLPLPELRRPPGAPAQPQTQQGQQQPQQGATR